MEGVEAVLAELWYRVQDESLGNADIHQYLARINAYIGSLERVNDSRRFDELVRALEDVRQALVEILSRRTSTVSSSPLREYSG